MGMSTIWLAQEENGNSLSDLIDSIRGFYRRNGEVSVEYEEDYKFGIGELEEQDSYFIGSIVKYYKEPKTTTYLPQTREITEERTHGNPLLSEGYFAISGTKIAVEERVPHLGHVLMVKILKKISEEQGVEADYRFNFVNSPLAIDEIFSQIEQEKIIKIKFKNIKRNPDPEDESLRRFEELTNDTGSKDIEFSNAKEGINGGSTFIKGGKILAEESRVDIHIETETEGKPKVYDTSQNRNKIREKIEFKDKTDHLNKFKEKILSLFR